MKIPYILFLIVLECFCWPLRAMPWQSFWRSSKNLPIGKKQFFFSYAQSLEQKQVAQLFKDYSQADVLEAFSAHPKIVVKSEDPQAMGAQYRATLFERKSIFKASLAYGMSSQWSVGFALPVEYKESLIKEDVVFDGVIQSQLQSDPQQLKIAQKSVQSFHQQQMKAASFKDLNAQTTQAQVNDLELLSKYQLMGGDRHQVYLNHLLRVPLGKGYDSTELLSSYKDKGQWDFGTSLNWGYHWSDQVQLWMGSEYTFQLADEMDLRVPEGSHKESYIAKNVKRDLGDWVSVYAGVSSQLTQDWSIELNYEVKEKFKDRLSGFSEQNEVDLTQDTSWQTQKVEVSFIRTANFLNQLSLVSGHFFAGLGWSSLILKDSTESQAQAQISVVY